VKAPREDSGKYKRTGVLAVFSRGVSLAPTDVCSSSTFISFRRGCEGEMKTGGDAVWASEAVDPSWGFLTMPSYPVQSIFQHGFIIPYRIYYQYILRVINGIQDPCRPEDSGWDCLVIRGIYPTLSWVFGQ
jgi:hypothetical protein